MHSSEPGMLADSDAIIAYLATLGYSARAAAPAANRAGRGRRTMRCGGDAEDAGCGAGAEADEER
eukprot:5384040-Pyramimonas_sp.AAC.1